MKRNRRYFPLQFVICASLGGIGIVFSQTIFNNRPNGGYLGLTSLSRYASDSRLKSEIIQLSGSISSSAIEKDVVRLSGRRHYSTNASHLDTVRTYIMNTFTEHGLTVTKQAFSFVHEPRDGYYLVDDSYSDPSKQVITGLNIIGELKGTNPSEGVIVIGAHLDATMHSPGADDNASGLSGMLACMKVLSQVQTKRSVLFVAFDQEEIGLLGSNYFVTKSQTMGRKVDAYINLDMIGYYDDAINSQPFPSEFKEFFPGAYAIVDKGQFRADFILNTSNERSRKLMEKFDSCAMLFVPGLKVLSLPVMDDGRFAPGAFRSSDHVPFWNAGIDAIAIGDTGDVRNTNYHSPDDVVETINFNFICNVSRVVLCTTLYLAQFEGEKLSTHKSTEQAKLKR